MYNLTNPRNAIREVQRYLLEISYATDGIPHISIDGIYGAETRNAVSLFQLRNGLPRNGEVDFATWKELYHQFQNAQDARTEQPILLPPNSLPLALHARGSEVALLQTILSTMREIMTNIPPISQNGNFDTETQRALRVYQNNRHLPPSGILDNETWTVLTRDYQTRENHAHYAG